MRRIKLSIAIVALLLAGILVLPAGPASAAGLKASRASSWRNTLPFPRSERAQSVWASGACWSDCGSHCAWGQTGCLSYDAQGQCVKLTDACDRYCQRACRPIIGGPLLPVDFMWE